MTKALTQWHGDKWLNIRLEFKVQDLWVGAYWNVERYGSAAVLHVWVCLLPCLPIHITWVLL